MQLKMVAVQFFIACMCWPNIEVAHLSTNLTRPLLKQFDWPHHSC